MFEFCIAILYYPPMDIISAVKDYLNQEVPITESDQEDALIALEKLRLPLLEARIEAQTELLKRRNQYLHPKDKNLTELDRKTMLDAQMTAYLKEYELLNGLEYLLKDRHRTLSLLLDLS